MSVTTPTGEQYTVTFKPTGEEYFGAREYWIMVDGRAMGSIERRRIESRRSWPPERRWHVFDSGGTLEAKLGSLGEAKHWVIKDMEASS